MSELSKDRLGDRQKSYETKEFLDKTKPVIIRIDGKAFHTYTRGMDKPFDDRLMTAMNTAAKLCLEEIQCAFIAYVQSDEATFVLYNTNQYSGGAWFELNKSKIESVSASMFSVYFNNIMPKIAFFDSRAFNVPNMPEAVNNVLWRMFDWRRNFVSSVAYTNFSHKSLEGKNMNDRDDLLKEKLGDWRSQFTPDQQFGRMFALVDGKIQQVELNTDSFSYDFVKDQFLKTGIHDFLFEKDDVY